VAEASVVDASPLIYLARAGFLRLLRVAGEPAIVPQAVADEVLRRGKDDPAAAALASTSWLRITSSIPVPPSVQTWDLGAGESSVLAWALAHPGSETILDDLQARHCASAHRLPVRALLVSYSSPGSVAWCPPRARSSTLCARAACTFPTPCTREPSLWLVSSGRAVREPRVSAAIGAW